MVVDTDRKLLIYNDLGGCHTMRLASGFGRWRSPDMPSRRPVSLYRRDLPPFKMAQSAVASSPLGDPDHRDKLWRHQELAKK